VSASFCYYFHTLTVCFYCCAIFVTFSQLVFRYLILHSDGNMRVEWWCFPFTAGCVAMHINASHNQTETEILEEIVHRKFPEFSELPINGHDSFSIPVVIVNCFYLICLPSLWSTTFLLRSKILTLLEGQVKMSQRSKLLQKAFVKSVTVQACLSLLALYPSFAYFIGQLISIHEENFLDGCFFFLQLQFAITPLVTIYYIPNYRRAVRHIVGLPSESSLGPNTVSFSPVTTEKIIDLQI
ncbi:hypothetical protein PMAYCL1PPCAC_13754, partial [Pristionchus mayeri]